MSKVRRNPLFNRRDRITFLETLDFHSMVRIPLKDISAKAKKVKDEMLSNAAKQAEMRARNDIFRRAERVERGYLGEFAIEVLYDIKFVDTSIGCSRNYDYPDLRLVGFDIGVKGANIDSVQCIKPEEEYPQFITFIAKNNVLVAGIAEQDNIQNHLRNDFVYDERIITESGKSGYWGHHGCIAVPSSLKLLTKLSKEKNWLTKK